jgi:hypothetical protein
LPSDERRGTFEAKPCLWFLDPATTGYELL